jgi:hypothetical protein
MRAGVFASVCVLLSSAGHGLMAARPAPLWADWAALAVLTAVGYSLADRRRSVWWILLAVESVQACLHVWFDWSSPGRLAPAVGHLVMPMPGHPVGMHHLTGTSPMPMTHGGGLPEWGMFVAHVLAGVLVAAWLYAGERAAWRALTAIMQALLDPVLRAFAFVMGMATATGPCRAGIPRKRGGDDAPPVIVALRHVLVRRGPPLISGALLHVST